MVVADWNAGLLEELLPRGRDAHPVVLACDDESVRAAGRRIGHEPDTAIPSFVAAVKARFHPGHAGAKQALTGAGAVFAAQPRPRPVPEFFSALCLYILAASRMRPEKGHATHAYYPVLRELLGIGGTGEVEGFWYVECLFPYLAEWLVDDEGGDRGRLILPNSPTPPLVGYPISQTVFRERDRNLLSNFFADRLTHSSLDVDNLWLLRHWSGRHQLTKQALDHIADPTLSDQVRAALRSAHRSWDGSVLTASGARTWPARLRLETAPGRLLFSAAPTMPLSVQVADKNLEIQPGSENVVPNTWLTTLQTSPVVLTDQTRKAGIRIGALGTTALFEVRDDSDGWSGLWRVAAATGKEAWLVTRDPGLVHRFARFLDGRAGLPLPWQVLGPIPVDQLPASVRGDPVDERRPILSLEGGLPVAPRTYLSGGGPAVLAGDLDTSQALGVVVNGIRVGTISSGGRVDLPADEAGLHRLIVADGLFQSSYEVVQQSPTFARYGTLSYQLGPRALTSGATPASDAETHVSGALVTPFPAAELPIMRSSRQPVMTIDMRGQSRWHRPTEPAQWLRLLKIKGGERWEIDGRDVVWVLCPSPSHLTALLWGEQTIERLDAAAADVVRDLAPDARPTARGSITRDPGRAWAELVALAAEGPES